MMTVDQRYESTISPSGIITLSTAWVNDTTVERFEYKRCYGRIEACPSGFSDKTAELIDPGAPWPRKHISGEYIEQKVKMGYTDYHHKRENYYCCAGMDSYDAVTMADIAKNCDIRRFDKVYFDARITEPKNMLGMHQGRELYKINVNEIVCVVRDGEILVQGNWNLVEPEMETWESITTKAGIIKKPAPEAVALIGKMAYMQHREDLSVGDRIIYYRGANWTIKVEGKEYYAIEHQDILAKLQP